MENSKFVSTPLVDYLKLGLEQCPTSQKEKEEMQKTSYSYVVGSLVYALVCVKHIFCPILGS